MDVDVSNFSLGILCAAFFLLGLFDAVCGGGGLISMPTFLSLGFPVHFILGTTQCSALPGAAIALLRFIRGGRVYWKTALLAAPLAAIGGFLGARLNIILPAAYLQMVMVILLPIMAVFMLVKRDFGMECHPETLSRGRIIGSVLIIGLVIGTYQGFYGAGCGLFYLLAFTMLNRLDMITASGNSKVVMLCANVIAALTYALSGVVVWKVVFWVVPFNILGNYIGANLALTKGAKVIRPMFFFVLGLLFVRMIFTVFFGE